MAEGKEKSGFILWILNPSQSLYLKYIHNVPYSQRNKFSIIKGKKVQVGEVRVTKATHQGGERGQLGKKETRSTLNNKNKK